MSKCHIVRNLMLWPICLSVNSLSKNNGAQLDSGTAGPNFVLVDPFPLHMQGFIMNLCICKGKGSSTRTKIITNFRTVTAYDTCIIIKLEEFCLFDLILYVPSTNIQLNRYGYSWVEPVLS